MHGCENEKKSIDHLEYIVIFCFTIHFSVIKRWIIYISCLRSLAHLILLKICVMSFPSQMTKTQLSTSIRHTFIGSMSNWCLSKGLCYRIYFCCLMWYRWSITLPILPLPNPEAITLSMLPALIEQRGVPLCDELQPHVLTCNLEEYVRDKYAWYFFGMIVLSIAQHTVEIVCSLVQSKLFRLK